MTGNGAADTDALVRAGRAKVALLSLELRRAVHEAEVADRGGVGVDRVPDAMHFQAREQLREALGAKLLRRRSELDAEVDQARARAAHRVIAAQAEADAAVAAAHAELRHALGPPVFHADVVPGAARPSPSRFSVAPGAESAPVATENGVAGAGDRRPGGHFVDTTVVAARSAPVAPPVARRLPPAPVASVPAPVVAPVAHRPRPADRKRPGAFRARLLHADVLLPLIAGLAVFVGLLAFLG